MGFHAPVERPQPLQQHVSACALPADPSFLRRLFSRFLERSTEAERLDLKAWLAHDMHSELTVATACSGTDAPLLVWDAFASAVNTGLGADVRVVHRFSCERDKHKQSFLRSVLDQPIFFEDATQLGQHRMYDAASCSQCHRTCPSLLSVGRAQMLRA